VLGTGLGNIGTGNAAQEQIAGIQAELGRELKEML